MGGELLLEGFAPTPPNLPRYQLMAAEVGQERNPSNIPRLV